MNISGYCTRETQSFIRGERGQGDAAECVLAFSGAVWYYHSEQVGVGELSLGRSLKANTVPIIGSDLTR